MTNTNKDPFEETLEQNEEDIIPDVENDNVPDYNKNTADAIFTRNRDKILAGDRNALNEVVDSLKPVINYTLSSMNSLNDPVLRSEAKFLAADSILQYDPSYGAGLPTFLTSRLRKLHRRKREIKSSVKVSDRYMMDNYALQKAERDYLDKHGEEPDLLQLSDFSGIPVKKINKLRAMSFGQSGEGAFGGDYNTITTDHMDEAADYVYMSADHKDRAIMEHLLGYANSKQLTPAQLADKLGISQSQVSRRQAALALQIRDIEDALRTVT